MNNLNKYLINSTGFRFLKNKKQENQPSNHYVVLNKVCKSGNCKNSGSDSDSGSSHGGHGSGYGSGHGSGYGSGYGSNHHSGHGSGNGGCNGMQYA